MSTAPAITNKPDAKNGTYSGASDKQSRLSGIDGLRGIACLMVLLGHSSLAFGYIDYPSIHLGLTHLSQAHLFHYGYGGVDLFFVLSGFCLAYPIVSRPDRAVNWKQYAINRVRRIFPPYWTAMLLFGCLSLWMTHHPIQLFAGQHILEWPRAKQLLYSVLLVSSSFNASFWTLVVEWRWYFVLPALIWLWRRFGASGVMLCTILISLISIFVFIPSHQASIKFFIGFLPMYLPLFGLGIWAASLAAGRSKYSWEQQIVQWASAGVGLTSLTVVIFAPLYETAFSISGTLLRLATWGPFCFFLVLAATQEGRVRRFASLRPLVWVGTFSYSLYLVHEPFLQMAAALILRRHWSIGWVLLLQIVVLPAILIGFGYLFFLVAEKPFLRRPVKKAIEAEQHGIKLEGSSTSAAS